LLESPAALEDDHSEENSKWALVAAKKGKGKFEHCEVGGLSKRMRSIYFSFGR
jgi:hypothetical protein